MSAMEWASNIDMRQVMKDRSHHLKRPAVRISRFQVYITYEYHVWHIHKFYNINVLYIIYIIKMGIQCKHLDALLSCLSSALWGNMLCCTAQQSWIRWGWRGSGLWLWFHWCLAQSDHVQHQQDIARLYIVYSDAQSVFVQLTFISWNPAHSVCLSWSSTKPTPNPASFMSAVGGVMNPSDSGWDLGMSSSLPMILSIISTTLPTLCAEALPSAIRQYTVQMITTLQFMNAGDRLWWCGGFVDFQTSKIVPLLCRYVLLLLQTNHTENGMAKRYKKTVHSPSLRELPQACWAEIFLDLGEETPSRPRASQQWQGWT